MNKNAAYLLVVPLIHFEDEEHLTNTITLHSEVDYEINKDIRLSTSSLSFEVLQI